MNDPQANQHTTSETERALRLDEAAPDFTARTTQGTRSLSDYNGKWLLLFSHPADFTPVCTSEFIAFENKRAAFKRENCELLGLSVDSVFSHRAWVQSIKDNFDIEISFPIIEDVSMVVAHRYGMIHNSSTSTATVRSVFFIDPNGILRALIHYPLAVGRSVDEILRVLTALKQTQIDDGIVLPEGWRPGQMALANPDFDLIANDHHDPLWYYKEIDLLTRSKGA